LVRVPFRLVQIIMDYWHIEPDVAPQDLPRKTTVGSTYSTGDGKRKIDRPYEGYYHSFTIENGNWHGHATHIERGQSSQFVHCLRPATDSELKKWQILQAKAIKYMSELLRKEIWK